MKRHRICIFGVEDLGPNLFDSSYFFANKFMQERGKIWLCLEDWFFVGFRFWRLGLLAWVDVQSDAFGAGTLSSEQARVFRSAAGEWVYLKFEIFARFGIFYIRSERKFLDFLKIWLFKIIKLNFTRYASITNVPQPRTFVPPISPVTSHLFFVVTQLLLLYITE